MILTRLYRIRQSIWWLLSGLLVVGCAPLLLTRLGVVDAQTAVYVVEPLLAVSVAVAARLILGSRRDHIRHTVDKNFVIGSALSVWFVVYFLSGLILTLSLIHI